MENKLGHNVIIDGLDILEVMKFIQAKNKKYQAILLGDIEHLLGRNSKEFRVIRKLILDSTNDYTRSVLKIIFGDIEGL